MKKLVSALIVIVLLTSACGNESNHSSEEVTSNQDMDYGMANIDEGAEEKQGDFINHERKVVQEGYLVIQTKDIVKLTTMIERLVNELGGYIVQSSIYDHGEQNRTSTLYIRVPSEDFQQFMSNIQDKSDKVIEKTIQGQDVTEEYTDLKSRLKAKRIVEERLLTFLQNANKTEDLLNISNDLGRIQEEIELILGRVTYLDNKINYASVTLNLREDKVIIPAINTDEFNTWEKAKKAFVDSVFRLIKLTSTLTIVFIGFLPYLLLLIIPGIIVAKLLINKRKKV
jgi:hypothetical protein